MKKKNKNKKNNSSKKKPKDAENSALRVRVALRAVRWGGAAIGAVSLPTSILFPRRQPSQIEVGCGGWSDRSFSMQASHVP